MPGRRALAEVRTFAQLVAYLRHELDWPIQSSDFEDLTFDYTPEELGIDARNAAKIQEIKRLRPLSIHQPWGVFFIKFEPKRLPVVALRRILGSVAVKRRATASGSERTVWETEDLLFISNHGEGDERQISFAHFAQEAAGSLPSLKVLGWDALDTGLHIDHVAETLAKKLSWPTDEADVAGWRLRWHSAFALGHLEVVATSKSLAIRLAQLARVIRERIKAGLAIETPEGALSQLLRAFRESLLHDLTPDDFADMYAQTIAYGLLTARIAHRDASRTDDLGSQLPVTNPFLKELMRAFLTGSSSSTVNVDFDELGALEVVELLKVANMEAVIRDFGDRNPDDDPVIHFYELFLHEYDAKKRMQRGVFYTPRPVVRFIVRSVHELLRSEWGLEDGLADTATWADVAARHPDVVIPDLVGPDESFVRILDPATGTGTFLVEVIDVIHETMTNKWREDPTSKDRSIAELWDEYVVAHLLPRLHGFELLMAPYAIAHLKIGLKLVETGYRFNADQRARIFLTNSLEPAHDLSGQLAFAIPALADEARAVSEVKKGRPFTVVIGNPPYSNFGQLNKNPFIHALLDDYKVGLHEKKLNLDDDYLKFVRLGQHMLERSSAGVLGYITNSSFLDGLVHRRMRETLITQFSRGCILDLHGSSRRREVGPDGSPDMNVFDIQQGVSVSLWVKRGKPRPASVGYLDRWGSRESKYEFMKANHVGSIDWPEASPQRELFLLKPQDVSHRAEYEGWLAFRDVFRVVGSGFNTDRDGLFIDFDRGALDTRMRRLFSGDIDEAFVDTYNLRPSSSYNPAELVRRQSYDAGAIRNCTYRPFDERWVYYKPGVTSRPVFDVQGHMLRPNCALLVCRQSKEPFAVLATRNISTHKIVAIYDRTSLAPLWLYDIEDGQNLALSPDLIRSVGLTETFMKHLASALQVGRNGAGLPNGVSPERIFSYIYATFHSEGYRRRYAEFLQTDFPRIPLPGTPTLFHDLANIGDRLVALHCFDSPESIASVSVFTGTVGTRVERVGWSEDTVWIDAGGSRSGQRGSVGFVGVPEESWEFRIGGYRVCEKWLYDRKDRVLSIEEVERYRALLGAIAETLDLVEAVDVSIDARGGWPGAFITSEDLLLARSDRELLRVAEDAAEGFASEHRPHQQ